MSEQHGLDLRRPAVVVALALPVLLVLAVGGLALAARLGAFTTGQAAETGPLAVVPVEAPEASSAYCTALLGVLPAELPADPPLPARPLAAPVEPGVAAWAAAPRPVVLRCGLPRPAELTPTSALAVVNGVSWLELSDGTPAPTVSTWIAVDRPVYVALTLPVGMGNGPITAVSDAIGATLPAAAIAVR